MDRSSIDFANTPGSPGRVPLRYSLREPEPPLVSIVTPFHNTGAVFWETHASVLGQTLQAWEWIIVDDCSQDAGAHAVLENLRNDDSRIHIIRHERNRGPAAARNSGVAAASCDYVALLDSDDLLEPVALESWLWFLQHHPGFSFVNGAEAGFGSQQFVIIKGFREREGFLEANRLNPTCLIRRSVYQQVGGMDETRRGGLEDWDFWLKCAAQGFWGETLEEVHSWYRRRPDHSDRWVDYDEGSRQEVVGTELRTKYGPSIQSRGFPRADWQVDPDTPLFESSLVGRNRLARSSKRAVVATCHVIVGGADAFFITLVKSLQLAGYDVTILITDALDNTRIGLVRSLTQDCIVLPSFLSPSLRPVFADYCIKSRDAELFVIASSTAAYSWAPLLRNRNPCLAIIDYLHIEEHEWRHGGYPRYAVIFDPAIDSHGASSLHLKNWLAAQRVAPDKIQLIYTGSDSALFDPARADAAKARARIGFDGDGVVITFVGRLCAQKRIDLLCAILAELAADPGLEFQAVIVGDGPDSPLVRKLVESDSSKRIKWLGTQTPDQIRDLLGVSHVLLLPSAMEGIALTLYEAMFMGVAIVASNVGGQDELVRPDCGLLIAKNADEMTEYVRALRSLITEPARARQLGAEGRRRARQEFLNEQIQSQLAEWVSSCRRLPEGRAADAEPWTMARMALFLQISITTEEEKLAALTRHLGSIEAALEKSRARVLKLEQRVEKLAAERDRLKAQSRELQSKNKSGANRITASIRSLMRRLFAGRKDT